MPLNRAPIENIPRPLRFLYLTENKGENGGDLSGAAPPCMPGDARRGTGGASPPPLGISAPGPADGQRTTTTCCRGASEEVSRNARAARFRRDVPCRRRPCHVLPDSRRALLRHNVPSGNRWRKRVREEQHVTRLTETGGTGLAPRLGSLQALAAPTLGERASTPPPRAHSRSGCSPSSKGTASSSRKTVRWNPACSPVGSGPHVGSQVARGGLFMRLSKRGSSVTSSRARAFGSRASEHETVARCCTGVPSWHFPLAARVVDDAPGA